MKIPRQSPSAHALEERIELRLVRECAQSEALARVVIGAVAERGQRLRTRLAIAAAPGAVDEPRVNQLVLGCVAIELLHLGTLVHDDLLDRDRERRSLPATWLAHGDDRAIVAGDAAFALAFELAAHAAPEFAAALATAFGHVCDGQMLELDDVGDLRSVERIEYIARQKTGSLFGAAALLGASVGGSSPAVYEEAGTALGTAYQLLDDLEDVAGRDGNAGSDLIAGLVTSPWRLGFDDAQLLKILNQCRAEEFVGSALTRLWAGSGPEAAAARIGSHLDVVAESGPFAASFCQEIGRRTQAIVELAGSER